MGAKGRTGKGIVTGKHGRWRRRGTLPAPPAPEGIPGVKARAGPREGLWRPSPLPPFVQLWILLLAWEADKEGISAPVS